MRSISSRKSTEKIGTGFCHGLGSRSGICSVHADAAKPRSSDAFVLVPTPRWPPTNRLGFTLVAQCLAVPSEAADREVRSGEPDECGRGCVDDSMAFGATRRRLRRNPAVAARFTDSAVCTLRRSASSSLGNGGGASVRSALPRRAPTSSWGCFITGWSDTVAASAF